MNKLNRIKIPVEEFSTPDPVTVSEDTTIEELNRILKEHGIRHLPVLRGTQVVGIISERDLKVVAGLNFKEKALVRAADIMARDPVSVSTEATLDEVAFEMSSRKIGSVMVTDGGNFFGIFTATDALNALIEVSRGSQT